jgi:hypothetical protein
MILRRLLLVLLLSLTLAWVLFENRTAQAHGGVVIQTGSFEHYEWLVQVYPFPAPPGVVVVTFFIFDYNQAGPAMDFTGELHLGAPSDTTACCEATAHGGPYPLYTDPVIYPGDYSAYVPLTESGTWQLKFVLKSPTTSYETIVPLEIQPSNTPPDLNAIATQAATMNAAAAAIQQNALSGSPLTTTVSISGLTFISPVTVAQGAPLPAPSLNGTTAVTSSTAPSGFNGWLWGGMAMIVVAGAVTSVVLVQREEMRRD